MNLPKLDLLAVDLPLSLRPVEVAVDEELVERWTDALGDCPACRSLVRDGFLPPMALTGNSVHLAFESYDMVGGIYSREQVTYHRPVELGDVLTIAGEIAFTYLKRGRRYRVMRSTSRNRAGEVVASSRSTGIHQLAPVAEPNREDAGDDRKGVDVPSPQPDHSRVSENPCCDRLRELEPGPILEPVSCHVTLDMMRAQAGARDHNPIHTDAEVARKAGLEAPIAGGPHVLAFLQEQLLQRLGEHALSYGAHFDVRWIRPIHAGADFAVSAEVIEAEERERGCRCLRLAVAREGEPAMIGRAHLPV